MGSREQTGWQNLLHRKFGLPASGQEEMSLTGPCTWSLHLEEDGRNGDEHTGELPP